MFLHMYGFHFLLGILIILREMKNSALAKFWGVIRGIMGDVKGMN